MRSNGIVSIGGKEYMTVAKRVELSHEESALEGVSTEVLSHSPVVVRATVTVKGKTYTGISAANPDSAKFIERQNPYEVAETSAVGRALGFAGYGLIESIASADEVIHAVSERATAADEKPVTCEVCGKPATEKKGITKGGRQYHGIFCSTEDKSHTRWLWN
jgi:hypothetical protein